MCLSLIRLLRREGKFNIQYKSCWIRQ